MAESKAMVAIYCDKKAQDLFPANYRVPVLLTSSRALRPENDSAMADFERRQKYAWPRRYVSDASEADGITCPGSSLHAEGTKQPTVVRGSSSMVSLTREELYGMLIAE
jgi:hypothetical protein